MPIRLSSNSIQYSASSGGITFDDSSYNVYVKNTPMFFARSTYASNAGPVATTYIFSDVLANVGSCYSVSTGRFTAPVSGNYFFFASSLSRSAGYLQLQIRVNGGDYVLTENTRSAMHGHCSPKCVVTLAANDYVTVYVSAAGGAYGSTYDYFGGWLIG